MNFDFFLSVTRFRRGRNFVFENIFISYFAIFKSGVSVDHVYNLVWPYVKIAKKQREKNNAPRGLPKDKVRQNPIFLVVLPSK